MKKTRIPGEQITDQMLVVALVLGLFYWVFESAVSVFSGYEVDIFSVISGDRGGLWKRMIVLCLFLIFGSHAQYSINKRKEAEKAVIKSDAQHRSLFESMAQGVIYETAGGTILSVNPSAEEITGFSLDDMQRLTSSSFWTKAENEDGTPVSADATPPVLAFRAAEPVTGKVLRIYNPRRRRHRWITVNAICRRNDGSGTPEEVIITFDDITDLKVIEEKLRRQNEYMTALHETALGLIHRLDLNDLLDAIVTRAAQMVGAPVGFIYLYDREKNRLELKTGYGKFAEAVGLILQPGEGLSGRVWQTGKTIFLDDYQSWPHRSSSVIFDDVRSVIALPLKSGNRVEGVIGMAHVDPGKKLGTDEVVILEQFSKLISLALDNAHLVTRIQQELDARKRIEKESRDMEHQLLRAQKLEAMGTLAGGIAHDFNNILSAIIGYTEMARFDLPETSKAHRNMGQVLKAGYRARDLAAQILAISRETRETATLIPVTPIVKEALKLLRASLPATIEIRQDIDPQPGMVLGNATEIHQVIMNLCTNASHAMEERGGILEARLSRATVPAGSFSDVPAGRYLILTVGDTGCGMSPAVLERIFDPYFTTKKPGKGTGLGLAITHRIIRNLKGAIHVASTPHKGSTFTVFLPAVEAESDAAPRAFDMAGGRGERILLVDDEPSLVELGEYMLQRLGYQVETMQNPHEVLKRVTEDPLRFDLVITDMTMPHMTGDILAGRLMRIRRNLPVILCTGFSEQMDEKKARQMGIQSLIMKPISIGDLSRAIRKALDSPVSIDPPPLEDSPRE